MSKKSYVQHVSGKGEKWELHNESACSSAAQWCVRANPGYHYLPKSEYILCAPPEEWVDVTAECHTIEVNAAIPDTFQGGIGNVKDEVLFEKTFHSMNYRLRKIDYIHNGPAFIVERRKS